MTERVKAPEAANARARIVIRRRYKALREGKRVDSPEITAGRLVAYAEDTALKYPVEPSVAYRQWVEAEFSERFLRFCPDSPIPMKVGAR